ncbi:hypothetical protein Tco_0746261 [Tanacetum coccineum]
MEKACHLPVGTRTQAYWALSMPTLILEIRGKSRKVQSMKLSVLRDKLMRIRKSEGEARNYTFKIKETESSMLVISLAFQLRFKIFSERLKDAVHIRYGYIKNHKKTVKNEQARTRESEETKKKPKNQSRSQKSQPSVK